MPRRISSSLGLPFSRRSPCARMIMPGVQKPHCSPCISRKASWSTCSVPSALAMPSIVRMSVPFAWTANMVHDFTDLPSRSTVQAPQWLVSQPICGPVRLSCSRRKWISSVRGSTKASTGLPLTLMAIWTAIASSSLRLCFGAHQGARQHDPRHLGAVLWWPAPVGGWRRDRLGRRDRVPDRGAVEARSDQDLGRLFGPQRGIGHVGEADRAGGDLAGAEREDHGGGGGSKVADLALELLIGRAVAARRRRAANGGQGAVE